MSPIAAGEPREASLTEETVLSDDILRQLINVGEVDLLVAVPTCNDARTIGSVVQAVRLGLLKNFPRERAVLVNADCGSRDGSVELARQASMTLPPDAVLQSLRTFHTVSAVFRNGAGRESSLRLLLAIADLLRAKACAVISPSEHVTPSWTEHLLAPIYRKNFDLVAPLYRRHKFDGLLVRTLLYPLVRALLGKRIREPYGSDFGFSGRLAVDVLLKEEEWQAEAGELGESLLLSMSAVMNGYRVCEAFVGPKDTGGHVADLVMAMRQSVGTMFYFLNENFSYWQPTQGSEEVPLEGGDEEINDEPQRIDAHRMYSMFQSGVADLQPVLVSIVSKETLADLACCAALGEEAFRFPNELWARTVYEFAASYHQAVISRDHIIQALVPLYRGKAYEFVVSNREANAQEIETGIEALCGAFERLKPDLLRIWNSFERGPS